VSIATSKEEEEEKKKKKKKKNKLPYGRTISSAIHAEHKTPTTCTAKD